MGVFFEETKGRPLLAIGLILVLCVMPFTSSGPSGVLQLLDSQDENRKLPDAKVPLALTDDETLLNFSSYLGGALDEEYMSVGCDAAGNIYVAGTTASLDFPLVNPFDNITDGTEGFVTKISRNGTIIYSSYIGGTGVDEVHDIFVDDVGYVYLTGFTASSDFPIVNAADSSLGSVDCFVSKINIAGTGLVYSTFIGGSSGEYARSIWVNEQGEAFVAGETYSSNFPTRNPCDHLFEGLSECFVSKLSQGGNTLLYSTLLGGNDREEAWGICVDAEGAIYVTGTTWSYTFPTLNAIDYAMSGDYDGFVTKINPSGTTLNYSTYLGGNDVEWGMAIAVDALGRAYALGHTTSNDFRTMRPIEGSYSGNVDGYLTVFNPIGSLNFSTYFGNEGAEWPQDIVVTGIGSAYVCGSSNVLSQWIRDSYDSSFNGGADGFVFRVNTDQGTAVLGSYLGGLVLDEATSMVVDSNGSMYVCGWTWSDNFPLVNPVDSTHEPGGYYGNDVFVSVIIDSSDWDQDGIPDVDEYILGTDSYNPDTDFDFLSDYMEVYQLGTNPLSNCTYGNGTLDGDLDHDGDALTNVEELYEYGTNLLVWDSDLDLLSDGFEVHVVGSLPTEFDSDFDSLSDWEEYMIYNTDCMSEDTDHDLMTDSYEVRCGLNPLVDDANGDLDGDLLTNLEEYVAGTSANNTDSDSDLMPDYWENVNFLNPLVDDSNLDPDNDMLTNIGEYQHGCSPMFRDCDEDSLDDGFEVLILNTDPLNSDSDFDSMPDGWEYFYGLNPLEDDTLLDLDSDGLSNLREYQLGTRPDMVDTDLDLYSDGWEVQNGFDPLDPYVSLVQSIYSKLPAILIIIAMPLAIPGFYLIGKRMRRREELEKKKESSEEIDELLRAMREAWDSDDED